MSDASASTVTSVTSQPATPTHVSPGSVSCTRPSPASVTFVPDRSSARMDAACSPRGNGLGSQARCRSRENR